MLAHVQRQSAAASERRCLTFQLRYFLAVGTSQHAQNLHWRPHRLLIIASDSHLDVQVCIAVIFVQVCRYIPVEQTGLGRGIEPDIVEDTGQAPVVLPFQIIAVAVFDDFHGQRVTTLFQIPRDIVLGWLLGALVVTHLLTVDPQERCRRHLLEAQEDLFAVPVGRNGECGTVSTRGVVVTRCLRRVGFERCGHVAEQRVAVAPHLPVRRHVDGCPFRVREFLVEEIGGYLLRCVGVAELPPAIEQDVMPWDVVRAAFLLSAFKHVEVLDVMIQVVKPSRLLCLCRCRHHSRYHQQCRE